MKLHQQQALMENLNLKVIELNLRLELFSDKIVYLEIEANQGVINDRKKEELRTLYKSKAAFKEQLLEHQQRMKTLGLNIRKLTLQKLIKK